MNFQKFQNLRKWSEEQWLYADFGDKRRNLRAVKLGINLMLNPQKSFPDQMQSWKDLKLAYRLFSQKDVTYEKVQAPHKKNTLIEIKKSNNPIILFIQDTTTIDYTKHKATTGLGPIADSRYSNKGFLLHTCLAITPEKNPVILGIAAQKAWIRKEKIYKGSETKNKRRKRKTEGDIWQSILEDIGMQNENKQYVSIGDRGNDIFDFFLKSRSLNWHYLVRLCQDRKIGPTEKLKSFIRKLSPKTEKIIEIRKKNGLPKTEIKVNVTWDNITIKPPQIDKSKNLPTINGWIIRCWNDEENLEWILFSSLPIKSRESALEKIDWYSKRWIIEEYHKCLKTGCNIEKRQIKTFDKLITALGFFAIIAIRLLQIRYLSRLPKDILAKNAVPDLFLKILCRRFNVLIDKLTIKDFWRKIAQLGGFLGRKSDGDPGWQTIWKGWLELQTMSNGAILGN